MEKLSAEEKLKKKKIWEHRQNTLNHFEIPPYSTPPRNAELDVSLDNDNGEEDQEVLDDLENEEKEEQGLPNANENKTKHDCDGFGCPFVIQEKGTWNIRCMMDQYQPERDEHDRRELMEAIEADNEAIAISMAKTAQEHPKTKQPEMAEVTNRPTGPKNTIKIYCAHNCKYSGNITCKATANIHDNVTDDEDDDITNSAKYVEFHGYNLPTSAAEAITLIAGKIENLKMQNTMKSKRTRQAKALASALALTRKKKKTTATAETKDPDNKETEDSLD